MACGCALTQKKMEALGITEKTPDTPEGWLIHLKQEGATFIPWVRRLELAGLVARGSADLIEDDHRRWIPIFRAGNLPYPEDLDRHARMEDDIVEIGVGAGY